MSTNYLLRICRRVTALWAAKRSESHLLAIREAELPFIRDALPSAGTVLEIGAGPGIQAQRLSASGHRVIAIDIAPHPSAAVPVLPYDGHALPFRDASFDAIYTSNVLEHISHLDAFQLELHRVLKPTAPVIHLLPTASWRFWSILTETMRYGVIPAPHGEISPTCLAELQSFRHSHWHPFFEKSGWIIEKYSTNGLFYTGASLMDHRLPVPLRRHLSRVLGSACHVFILKSARR